MSVLIVGAGPAGATTALLLARAGVEVTLLERERDFARVFRGEGLMPSGMDALYEMGLGELLASLPSRTLESWDLYVDGQPTFCVPEPVAELGDRAVRVIPQSLFLEAVVREAGKHPGFRLERGWTVRDLLRDPQRDGRVVGARVQTPDGPQELAADLVIGCDGRASVVRKRAGLELELMPQQYDVLWFKMPAPERLRHGCAFLMMATRERQAACYTSWDERLQFALAMSKGAYRERRNVDWIEEAALAGPDWLRDHIRSVREEVEGPMLLDVIVGRCPTWSAPGLLLIGDAAHPMAPIRAQGINLALRDAIVVANHVVPALRAGVDADAIDAAARAVQSEREAEVARSQLLQHRDTAAMNTRAAPFLIFLARHLGRWLGRYGWAQRAWLNQQRDLRLGSTEVRLLV